MATDTLIAPNNRGKSFKKFDLDLKFGEKWEDFIADKLTTAEVKTEKDMWKKTGNICVEYESYGKASGIEATESDVWIHNLTSNDEFVLGFIIPTETLKKIYKQGYPVKGGDHNASRIYLLKIKELVDKILKEEVQ